MAKKTAPQGIGTINNRTEFDSLVVTVANIIIEAFENSSVNETAINKVKSKIDNLVGRSRTNFTKTDVYQISYLIFYPILKELASAQNTTFKETQINTLVAKLMTEGQYGNPSVVRRQTTDAKLLTLRARLFPSLVGGIVVFANYVFYSLSGAQQRDLTSIAKKITVRGTRSTSTQRVSNRSFTATSPRSTTPRTTPATPVAPQVTQTTGEPERVRIPNTDSVAVLLVALRETIKRFGETRNDKAKLQFMIDAWRFAALCDLKLMLVANEQYVEKETFRIITSRVTARIGDIYNPANDPKYKSALKFLGYVVYLFCSGKIRTAQFFSLLILRNQSREQVSAEIFQLGIGRRSAKVFENFYLSMPGGRSITMMIDGKFRPSFARRIRTQDLMDTIFSGTTRPTATVTEIDVPGYNPPPQTSAISVLQLNRNATPSRVEVNATPEGAVTDLVKEAKFKNTLGIEIEYQEVSFGELKKALTAAKIDVWPRYLEYHQSCNYDKYKQWRIMHDGSVKDRFENTYPLTVYRTGAGSGSENDIMFGECVSPILVGERGLLQLIRVLNVMTKLGATNNLSTGIHIHLGIRDRNQPYGITYKGLRNFIINYMGFEKIIDAYVRQARRQNKHGYTPSPIADFFPNKSGTGGTLQNVTYSELEQLSTKFNAMDDAQFIAYATRTLSRGKINAGSNNLKFSFEIRQHGGTIERDTLIGWILFMNFLCVFSEKKVATKFTWKNLRDNILPKQLASFWENRITDMSGTKPDDFDGPSK